MSRGLTIEILELLSDLVRAYFADVFHPLFSSSFLETGVVAAVLTMRLLSIMGSLSTGLWGLGKDFCGGCGFWASTLRRSMWVPSGERWYKSDVCGFSKDRDPM